MPRTVKTVRETLQANELQKREADARKTKFDAPATIVREGSRIVVPENMAPEEILRWIRNWVESEEKTIQVAGEMPGIPVDAAFALQKTVLEELGYTSLQATPGFFGDTPPTFMAVPIDHTGQTVDVYVGRIGLPGLDSAWLQTMQSEDRTTLHYAASIRKKDQVHLNQILVRAAERVREQSLYKGRAFQLDLEEKDGAGEAKMIIPKFWNLDEKRELILNDDAERMIQATIWTPIVKAHLLRANKIPIKRTVLLNGKFGTGKTLCAYRTAQVSEAAGFSFAYVKNIGQLVKAFDFMQKNLAPGVIFCEDMDQAFADHSKLNQIQNTLDGIDSKNSEVIMVLTTNYVEQIPPAVVRPGRIDTIINIEPPDEKAAAKLINLYGRGLLSENVDLEVVGKKVAGNIPAVIREVVERAKLHALSESDEITLTTESLVDAAEGMAQHLALLNRGGAAVNIAPSALFGHAMGTALGKPMGEAIREAMKDIVSGTAFNGSSKVEAHKPN